MLIIQNQIRKPYASSALGNLSLTGAWVAILAARGFTLPEIGLAETAYHAASLLTGILSGAMADDALQVRTNTRLQNMFPSENRATLISMESFAFSIIMIVLSPLAGFFFSAW